MQKPPNVFFRLMTGLAGLAILLTVVSKLINAYGFTSQDARISNQIRIEFEQTISEHLPSSRHVSVSSSPRRNGTFLIVAGGALSVGEKEIIALQAKQIGRRHENREVTIVFRN